MAELVTTIRVCVLALLVRRGVIEDESEQLMLLPDELAGAGTGELSRRVRAAASRTRAS